MQLSKAERLALANQYRILKALDPEQSEYYDRSIEVVERGYEAQYAKLAENLYDPMTEDQCDEVRDILGMYMDLGNSYDDLSDKSGVDPHSVEFPGFDDSEEGAYLAYALFLKGPHNFRRVNVNAGPGSNVGAYRRMLVEFKKCGHRRPLLKSEILAITGAAVHPSNRTPAHSAAE